MHHRIECLRILVHLVVRVVGGLARFPTSEHSIHEVALQHVQARCDQAEGELEPTDGEVVNEWELRGGYEYQRWY